MLALALAIALTPAPTRADEPTVRLHWEAPAGCPTTDDLRRGIEALQGGPLDAPGRNPSEIEGRIVEDGERWSLTLRIASDAGARVRVLPGTSCQELTDVAVVLIAVAIDPSVAPEPPEPPPAVAPEAPPPSPAKPPPRREPPTATTRSITGAIGVHGGVGYGALPRVAGGLGIDGALLRRRLRLELAGTFWLPRDTITTAPAGGAIRLWHLDARACGVPRWRHVELPLCGGLEVGAMAGRAHGVRKPRLGRLPWFAIEASAGLIVLPIPRAGVRLDLRGAIPVVRPGFAIDGTSVHRARVATVTATLGVEIRLP